MDIELEIIMQFVACNVKVLENTIDTLITVINNFIRAKMSNRFINALTENNELPQLTGIPHTSMNYLFWSQIVWQIGISRFLLVLSCPSVKVQTIEHI